jgi:hypothetical protein
MYRRVGVKKIVPDETSNSRDLQALSECGKVESTVTETSPHFRAAKRPDSPEKWPGKWQRCRICGRMGRLDQAFSAHSKSKTVFLTRSIP